MSEHVVTEEQVVAAVELACCSIRNAIPAAVHGILTSGDIPETFLELMNSATEKMVRADAQLGNEFGRAEFTREAMGCAFAMLTAAIFSGVVCHGGEIGSSFRDAVKGIGRG